MGRSKLPDFDAERPPELGGLPIFSIASNTPPEQDCARYSVELAFGERSRSRLKVECRLLQAVTSSGSNQAAFETANNNADENADENFQAASFSAGIVLPRGTILRGGAWVLGEGRALHVLAADEDLLEVSVSGDDNSQLALLKAAYHLGNRHVALQVAPTLLKLEYDYVLADMLVAMGLKVQRRFGPFEPEWGAYAAGHHH